MFYDTSGNEITKEEFERRAKGNKPVPTGRKIVGNSDDLRYISSRKLGGRVKNQTSDWELI